MSVMAGYLDKALTFVTCTNKYRSWVSVFDNDTFTCSKGKRVLFQSHTGNILVIEVLISTWGYYICYLRNSTGKKQTNKQCTLTSKKHLFVLFFLMPKKKNPNPIVCYDQRDHGSSLVLSKKDLNSFNLLF